MSAAPEDNAEVFVLEYKLKLSHPLDALPEDVKYFFIDQGTQMLMFAGNDWIKQSVIDSELQTIFNHLHELNMRCKGVITCFQRFHGEDNSTLGGRYRIDASAVTFENCELHVTVKSNKPSDPKLSEEDKKLLFIEYWNTYQRVPRSTEKYKGFNIGGYYHTAKKNKDLFDKLTEITGGSNK